jgi:drug/metabolite transporter (DMT)-like permease
MTSPTPRERRLAYFSWITVCIVWGTTYLAIRVSLETMPPMLMGGLRWLLAGSLLAAYVVASGERLPGPARWGGIVLLGFLMLGLGNGGVVVAEQWVPSGLAAVIVASNPFWMAAVEAALPDGERLQPNVIAGLITGFTGIVVLVWPDLTLHATRRPGFLAGVVALQIASIGWSLGSSYSRRHTRRESVLALTACQMLAGGSIMTVAGSLLGEWSHLSFTTETTLALVYLSTVGAIGGLVAYNYALRHLPVSFVSLYAYINPVIAVALGVLLLHESFDSRMAVAAALVFVGVAVVRWSRTPSVARRPLEPQESLAER